ncbi:MAG: hypothetical protein EBU90_15735 [Proteobacteria bacterium]|nr:hypothetical protein [Pseudomonadota bacterium]
MAWRRIKQGQPYVFQELVFFSPRQFDEPVELEDKEFIFRLKVCTNSGRCFTGPFYNEVIGEEELTKKEFNNLMDMVHNTPGIIITGKEYVRYDDYGGLKKIYG